MARVGRLHPSSFARGSSRATIRETGRPGLLGESIVGWRCCAAAVPVAQASGTAAEAANGAGAALAVSSRAAYAGAGVVLVAEKTYAGPRTVPAGLQVVVRVRPAEPQITERLGAGMRRRDSFGAALRPTRGGSRQRRRAERSPSQRDLAPRHGRLRRPRAPGRAGRPAPRPARGTASRSRRVSAAPAGGRPETVGTVSAQRAN